MERQDRYDSLFQFYRPKLIGWPWQLSKAQAVAESAMNPRAVSPVGAVGLMQFMPATFAEIMGKDKDPFDPEVSIQAHSIYIPRISHYLGTRSVDRILAAYNWGMGNVKKLGNDWIRHLPDETVKYLDTIHNYYLTSLAPE